MKLTELNNLIHIHRWAGTQLIKSESVADHVWGMIAISLSDLPKINMNRKELGHPEVNLKEVIFRISVHDLDEAFTTDIPRPFKYHSEEFHEAVEKVTNEIMSENLAPDLVKMIQHSKDDTLEGYYVRSLDFIQAGLKMVNEVDLGNRFMKKELPNVIECLGYLIEEAPTEVETKYLTEYKNYFSSKL